MPPKIKTRLLVKSKIIHVHTILCLYHLIYYIILKIKRLLELDSKF